MTVRLLSDFPIGRFIAPAGRTVLLDPATETGLIAANLAVNSTASPDWTVPVETPGNRGQETVGITAAALLLPPVQASADQTYVLLDGPWRGYRVRWAVPEGETQPAWCHDAFPHRFP